VPVQEITWVPECREPPVSSSQHQHHHPALSRELTGPQQSEVILAVVSHGELASDHDIIQKPGPAHASIQGGCQTSEGACAPLIGLRISNHRDIDFHDHSDNVHVENTHASDRARVSVGAHVGGGNALAVQKSDRLLQLEEELSALGCNFDHKEIRSASRQDAVNACMQAHTNGDALNVHENKHKHCGQNRREKQTTDDHLGDRNRNDENSNKNVPHNVGKRFSFENFEGNLGGKACKREANSRASVGTLYILYHEFS
jgi:hypothetical protein